MAETGTRDMVDGGEKRDIRWPGLALAGLGSALAIASVFTPWVEVWGLELIYPPEVTDYSPWTALWRWPVDGLTVAVVLLMALVIGALVAAVWLGMARGARTRARAGAAAVILATLGLVVTAMALVYIPLTFSFGALSPHHTLAYGGGLAAVGFILVIVGVALVGPWERARPARP